MKMEFNGVPIDVPDDSAILMLSNADLAEGVESFARDYEMAINENPTNYGDRITAHRWTIRIMREAARRLSHSFDGPDSVINLSDDNEGFMKGFGN